MIIIVLGSDGFIGKALLEGLEKLPHKVIKVNRLKVQRSLRQGISLRNSEKSKDETTVFINLIGSWRESSDDQLFQDNFATPKKLLEQELAFNSNFVWVQASSYFQLYMLIHGKDKDKYSMLKREFSEFLQNEVQKGFHIDVIDYLFPHIVGPGEHPSRVFPQIRQALSENRLINLTSGETVIPILDVRDLVEILVTDIKNGKVISAEGYTVLYPQVTRIAKLSSHVESLAENKIHLCRFGAIEDRENEFRSISELREFFTENSEFRKLSSSP